MRIAALALSALLAGCAVNSAEYVAHQSNYDVCRLTMGGPHSMAAEQEARSRNLDCGPLYPAISAREAARTQAILQYMQMTRPQPIPQQPVYQAPQQINCQTYRLGDTLQTNCR